MKELFENLLKLQELEFGNDDGGNVDAAISALRQEIPLPILEHYNRLTARGKKAVALVRHQVCTGCHMTIPIGAINTLMHAEDIQMCENCGRYLYLPSDARDEFIKDSERAKTDGTKSRTRRALLSHAM